jgi:flagellar hook-basal body complex protein FliE
MENFDLKIRKFEQFLINYINSVDELPIEVKRLVVQGILNQIQEASDLVIKTQQANLNKPKESEENAESL